jgi:lysophospholipase L1-like esterase
LRRTILTRLALVIAGFVIAAMLLTGIEFALRVFGVGGALAHDPFAGFSNLVPMFERVRRSDGVQIYRTTRGRTPGLDADPAEFLAEKPPNGYRIFVIGGSSAAGVPYGYRYSFAGWLERRLRATHPDRFVEVVNAAVSGYSSRRALMVAREIDAFEPDLLIVYSGHNERAEKRYYKHLLEMDPRVFAIRQWFYSTHLYGLASGFLPRSADGPGDLNFDEISNSNQMFAVADRRIRGADLQDEQELEYEAIHFRFNLEAMADAMQEAELMLLSISQDFADWPPGTSVPKKGLSHEQTAQFDELIGRGRTLADEDCEAALPLFEQALAIDTGFAALHFEIANCQRRMGQLDRAREHYRLASDLDRVPLGANTHYNEIIRDVAKSKGAYFVDIHALMERLSPGGLVGRDLFVDLLHPNLFAHQRIAEEIASVMSTAALIAPTSHWRSDEFVDPDAAGLLASNPDLVRGEHLVRAFACVLARQRDCALAATQALLSTDPDDERARQLQRQARELPQGH